MTKKFAPDTTRDPRLHVRLLPVALPDATWLQAEHLVTALNYDRSQNNEPPIDMAQALGAVFAAYCDEHHEEPSTLPPLPVLPTLPALSSPTFDPTLTSPSSVPSTPGLFEALLGDPRILLRDYLEHPTHYEPELLTTLTSLLSGNKTLASLTNEERDLLNQSTTTYAEQPNSSTTSSTKPPDALPFQTRPPRDDEDEDEEETDEEPWRDSQEDPLLSFNEDPAPHEDDDVAPPVATGWWNHLP